MSSKDEPYNEPTHVTADEGDVVLKGPDGVDVRMTPDAADETAGRLIEGAAQAAGQERLKGATHQAKR